MIEGAREQQDRAVGGMSTRAAWVLPLVDLDPLRGARRANGTLRHLTPTLPGRFEGYWWFPNLGFFLR